MLEYDFSIQVSEMNLSEFFGFGGYARPAEGYMSWQHLTFVSLLTVVMTLCAVILGRRYRNRDAKQKNVL